ncbi:MAG: thiamine pyrophosphate-binding protein [Granulosicoccus sp.]
MTSIGEALIGLLAARGVTLVFGIPGVHTIELYRGLPGSNIRHITARHEQGAGFMADGYARVSGMPGVVLVISGPGVSNTLTPMAQARADSVPMLVLSGVSSTQSLGRGFGHLHELPDQQAMVATVAISSRQIRSADDLLQSVEHAFELFSQARGGPVHIEIPIDVMSLPFAQELTAPSAVTKQRRNNTSPLPDVLRAAKKPLILAGGGTREAARQLLKLAELLDAPVVQTVNARGLMHAHPLCVPASPSLAAVRELIADADVVLALGTELGPTDYDMYADGGMPSLANLVRVDICHEQLARHPAKETICGRVDAVLGEWLTVLEPVPVGVTGADRVTRPASAAGSAYSVAPENTADAAGSASRGARQHTTGAQRAGHTRQAALQEIGQQMRLHVQLLEAIRSTIPNAILVGDSTQTIYAGNLYYDHDRPGGWFNAATGYGALGYAIPAAIGASLADPATQIVCISGDGGAQFSTNELMTAVDEQVPVLFLICNNHGYQEIATSMIAAGVPLQVCAPAPPDFQLLARACGIPWQACAMCPKALATALSIAMKTLRSGNCPVIIELTMGKLDL